LYTTARVAGSTQGIVEGVAEHAGPETPGCGPSDGQ